jgi:hypothetical protein
MQSSGSCTHNKRQLGKWPRRFTEERKNESSRKVGLVEQEEEGDVVPNRELMNDVRRPASFCPLQFRQQLLEIRALAQGGEVLVLLHVGGVPRRG